MKTLLTVLQVIGGLYLFICMIAGFFVLCTLLQIGAKEIDEKIYNAKK